MVWTVLFEVNAIKCERQVHEWGTCNEAYTGILERYLGQICTTFMRYGHGKTGIIGLTLKPETLNVWSLRGIGNGPVCFEETATDRSIDAPHI